jgi:cytochrome c peroxidase
MPHALCGVRIMKLHRLALCLAATILLAACSKSESPAEFPPPTPLNIHVPAGFPEVPQPDDNPLTVEGVKLGRLLFYDPILSGDSTQACGSCHLQATSFSDSRKFSEGIRGTFGNRHAPVIINPAYMGDQFWDGRVHSLEEQATKPVPNEIEMDLPWTTAIARLEKSKTYPGRFCAAFGDKRITMNRVVKAIAQFERTFLSYNSKYDRVQRGEDTFTPEEAAGERIFNTEIGDCFHCHQAPLFTSNTFHNTGLDSVVVDRGRYDVTGNPADMGKFKAPSLRNCTERYVFMHDSRFSNLHEVIDHYNKGFHDGPDVDPLIRVRLSRRAMRPGEIDTLIVFLGTLTDPEFITNPNFKNPYKP